MKENKSQLKIGIVLGYVNMLFGNLIPFFYTPIMLKLLGDSEYGLYKLASTATGYLSLISFGIGGATSRYLIKARVEKGKEEEEKIYGLFNTFFFIIAFLAAIAGVIISFTFEYIYDEALTAEQISRMRILILIITANTVIGFSSSPSLTVVSSHERFVFLQVMNIFTTCIAPIANLVALFMGYASIGLTVSSLVISVVVRVCYLIYIKRVLDLKPKYGKLPFGLIKEILLFSFWVFVVQIVNQLYQSTDTMIIGAIPELGTQAVARYNIGSVFSSMVMSLTLTISSVLTPKVNKMVFAKSDNKELSDFAIRIGRYQGFLVFLLCSGFVVFGRQFIEWYVGETYWESYWVALLIMLPSSIGLVQSVCLSILTAKNKHRFRALVYLGIAIMNVVGTYFLVNRYGIIGASAVTGIASIVGPGITMNWYYKKKLGLDIGRFWKNMLNIIWIPVCMCVVTLLLSRYIDFYKLPILFAGIITYTVIYALLCWRFSMNSEEKGVVLSVVNKFIKFKKTEKVDSERE